MEIIPKDCKDHPVCPHGPCLMFERRCASGSKTGKKYFACSACRDRAACRFFHWTDDDFSAQKKQHWDEIIEKSKVPFTHEEYIKRLTNFQKLGLTERSYCKSCSLLILPADKSNHQNHEVISKISTQHLLEPTNLFQILENKKAEAQYFFSEKTTQFVTKLLEKLGFSKILLIGVPKIHEQIKKQEDSSNLSSLMLDIDHRYMQFFGPEQFCHYNLFNNHFFGGKKCQKLVKQFLCEENGGKVAILLDPPFGGLIDAISYSLQSINQWWKKINSKQDTETIPLLWFFPYFLESRIIKNFPDMEMMDYKVEYLNHKKFGKKANLKNSPVRIFTNISSASFILPENEGYRFCKKCQKFVCKENLHCAKCNSCTTKHGSTYKHCDSCQRCVKSSFVHCDKHNKCSPKLTVGNSCGCSPNKDDGTDFERCYKCFGYGHRKRDCPSGQQKNKKKKTRK